MTTEEILLAILIVLAALNFIVLWRRGKSSDRERRHMHTIAKNLERVDQSQEKLRGQVDTKLENIHRAGQNQFREAREIISEITTKSDRLIDNVNKRLGDLDKTNQKIVDFSTQMKGLQDILNNPKQRGILGEVMLEQVLSNVLPPDNFSMQHGFENGEMVDAAVFAKDKVIPIDAKFSLENYNRFASATDKAEKARYEKIFINDLKLRIQETAKYIRPEEGTTDFAFMFVPSESIYYDLLSNAVGSEGESLLSRATGQYRVIAVSPTTFLAFLQTVMQGLQAFHIEERAQEIKKRVGELSKHWIAFDSYMQKMHKTLTTTVNHFNASYKELGKIDRDVMRITQRPEKKVAPDEVSAPTNDTP